MSCWLLQCLWLAPDFLLVCLFLGLFVLFVCLFVCLFIVCLFVCLVVCLAVCLFLFGLFVLYLDRVLLHVYNYLFALHCVVL